MSDDADKTDETKVSDVAAPHAWVFDLQAKGALVMHIASWRVGKIENFFDGVQNVYESPHDGTPVTAPVVVLDTGDAFVADPAMFRVLNEAETKLFALTYESMKETLGAIGAFVLAAKIDKTVAMQIVSTALRAQAQALAGPPPEAAL